MSFFAFVLIAFSAGMHASWNLIAKRSGMSIAFYTLLCLVSTSLWLHVQFWTPVNVFGLPGLYYLFMFGSVVFDLSYCIWLSRAYTTMEMSTAYPMMRSLPLIITALLTALTGWGEPLNICSITGMLIVFIGCLLMPLRKFQDFELKKYYNKQMLYILMVACGITGYTICDSQSQVWLRQALPDLSKPVTSLTFYSCRGISLTSVLLLTVFCIPAERKTFVELLKKRSWLPVLAGLCGSLTYSSVLLAMNYVSNVTYVQVFRQLGLVFGLIGGIFILKEKGTATKFAGVALIILGLIISVLKTA